MLFLGRMSQVVMLGVCPTRRAGGEGDLTIQPLPLYAVPSDNVVMTCVASSAQVRSPPMQCQTPVCATHLLKLRGQNCRICICSCSKPLHDTAQRHVDGYGN